MHSAGNAGLSPTSRILARHWSSPDWLGSIRRLSERARGAVRRTLVVLRQIIGAPDYELYLEHHRACHPGCPPLTPREHYAQFIAARHGSGVSRCC
jgi:uncharacterized short protein YbdD (DUF466 family)